MTFEDLPDDWRDRPLTDPTLVADVLDLVVTDRDRLAGGLAVLLCDADDHLLQPVVVAVAHPVETGEKAVGVARLCGLLADEEHRHRDGRGSVLVAVVRPTGPFVTDDDREWHEAAARAADDAGVRWLGMWLMTRHVVRPFPPTGGAVRVPA